MYGVKSDANHFNEISFTPRLKKNVRAARMRYQLYLEEQRKLHDKVIEIKRGKLYKIKFVKSNVKESY